MVSMTSSDRAHFHADRRGGDQEAHPSRSHVSTLSRDGVESFVPKKPAIQVERILRIQGYVDLERVRPAIRQSADSMAKLATQLSASRVAYRRVPIRAIQADVLELEGNVQFRCRQFGRVLPGCTEVIVFVLTLGPSLDLRVIELADAGDLLDALLLETAGWLCLEDATRQFKVHARDEAIARGHRITSRMGPGYSYKVDNEMCTWPLEEQAILFGLFGDTEIPVSIMASCAMQPKMSRSGLIGVAPLPAQARINGGDNAALRVAPAA